MNNDIKQNLINFTNAIANQSGNALVRHKNTQQHHNYFSGVILDPHMTAEIVHTYGVINVRSIRIVADAFTIDVKYTWPDYNNKSNRMAGCYYVDYCGSLEDIYSYHVEFKLKYL